MRKLEVKRVLGPKIKFGNSASSCKIGNYLFEDALPYTKEPYQTLSGFNHKYEDYKDMPSFVSSECVTCLEFRKEKWYIKIAGNLNEEFYLWKRIS